MLNQPGTTQKWWQRWWFRFILIFLGVGLLALLASMQMSGQACHFENKEIRYYLFLPINLIYFFCWGVLFFFIQSLCQLISKRFDKWVFMVLLHIGLGVFFSFLHLFIFHFLINLGIDLKWITINERYTLSTMIYRWMNSNIYIYIAMIGFLHFFYFFRQLREKELIASQLETQMVQIQLQSLKTQLHPHFLFNALNTISAYVKKNPDTAIKMTARLSDLLRLTLETKTNQEIPLDEELKIVHHYLEIEKLRFADRMEVRLDIAAGIGGALVPAMLLQPLVENAVRHGVSRKITKGTITISAHRENGKLHLQVGDDGPGMTEHTNYIKPAPGNNSNGIGLENIRERLQKLYGNKSAMVIHSKEDQGFLVKITIPLKFFSKKQEQYVNTIV